MGEFDHGELFVRVKDSSGEEFVCPLKALRNPKELTSEELAHCVDTATVGRYAGDIKIVETCHRAGITRKPPRPGFGTWIGTAMRSFPS